MSELIDLPKSNTRRALYAAGVGIAVLFGTAAIGFGMDHLNGCHDYTDKQRVEDAKVPVKCKLIPKPILPYGAFMP